jgi:hypothetical protein
VRHVRMLGLCLVAALALGAYAVSSASALEWGKCELVGSGGNYTGPNCTKAEKAKPKGTGSYEWRKASEVAEKRVAEGKPANVAFSGHNVGSGGVLTTGGMNCEGPEEVFYHQQTRKHCLEGGGKIEYFGEEGVSVECEAENNTGETEGKNKVANIHVTFTGCTLFGSTPCENGGFVNEEIVQEAPEGEVKTKELKGKLGWLNKSAKEVGVVLEPAAKHGLFAAFECAGFITTRVGVGNKKVGSFYLTSGCIGACETATPEEEKHGGYDQVISPITPVNTMTSEFTQVFKVNALRENEPRSFEGKHISQLEDVVQAITYTEPGRGIMWSPAGEEITNVNTPEEEGEIKA